MCDLAKRKVTEVRGIGAQRAKNLAKLGICSVMDLLEYFPYRYDDYRIRDVTEAVDGETVTLAGSVQGTPSVRWYGRKRSRLTVQIESDGVWVTAVWFNQHYLKDRLKPGQKVVLVGKWDRHRLQITVNRTITSPKEQTELTGHFEPVYSVQSPLSATWLRKVIRQAFIQYGDQIEDIIPAALMKRYKLISRKRAMYVLHFPKDQAEGQQARRHIAFEELFLFQLKLQVRRFYRKRQSGGQEKTVPQDRLDTFMRQLPFQLTNAQHRVIDEALRDLRQPVKMNRLLQGDVGSGKTIVAATLLYANCLAGFQGALMVPTEILAEQHAKTIQSLLQPYDIEVATLTGSLRASEKRDVNGMIQMGLAQIVIGTHALIQENVFFDRLGLVVTDEQHRFGVKQRALLREKGEEPDVLFMTATPIPRTLAITAFGDMDVSTLDEMPAGRKPVETRWVNTDTWEQVITFIRQQCVKGQQTYVICPLIDESEKLDLQNAYDVFAQIEAALNPHKTGLMHGKLPQEEKEAVMADFVSGHIQVLVSTTVVEVGVHVPNATVMVVYDADRFGLAQLHQLRGRVGRGSTQSYCILISDTKSETGKERMRIMCETQDGFVVAKKDMEMRGPGDFFGVKQSGLPEFKVADLMEDHRMLEVARHDAAHLVASSAFWKDDRFSRLRQKVAQADKVEGSFD